MNTRKVFQSLVVVTACLFAQMAIAQAPSGSPAGSTGLCKDGTYYSGSTKQGACRGHQGVKQWWGGASAQSKATPAAPATVPAPASSPKPAPIAPAPSKPASNAVSSTPAPGGGAGKVWLNSSTNVYHCQGSKYYGTTKQGTYMTESEAKAKGAHPDHGKGCS
jgi:hypothetical protein